MTNINTLNRALEGVIVVCVVNIQYDSYDPKWRYRSVKSLRVFQLCGAHSTTAWRMKVTRRMMRRKKRKRRKSWKVVIIGWLINIWTVILSGLRSIFNGVIILFVLGTPYDDGRG